MPRLFLKRSQATSGSGTKSTSTGGSSITNPFRRRRNKKTDRFLQDRTKPVQGSEAVAVESQRVNAKTFNYPEVGFETWIENSLLYTMIRESSIFPAETVLTAIDEEEYSQYFVLNEKEEVKMERSILDDYDDDDDDVDENDLDADQKEPEAAKVSYAQLTALLALAGEEWSSSSEVPQRICNAISKEVIKYANKHNLDREQELKELLDPLIDYAKGRGRKQMFQMLPWFAALTVSTVNPLTFYATYVSMLAANSENLNKGDRADKNTIDMAQMGNRHANVEKASLLDEDYYDDDDDDGE
ncbi:unnamed protein product [Pseudo-nitzschia multistriata]|uniref:Uncharacterized protein n=1 Tax=Pseudo-nitzschia multistriata TaxID=183589 RepID=A0A448Z8B3_9STRA|nr:unnamed protein product [Pseudo-nitzschia multistriata]